MITISSRSLTALAFAFGVWAFFQSEWFHRSANIVGDTISAVTFGGLCALCVACGPQIFHDFRAWFKTQKLS